MDGVVDAIRQLPSTVGGTAIGRRQEVAAEIVGNIGRTIAEVVEVVPESADNDLTESAAQADIGKTGFNAVVLVVVNAGFILIKPFHATAQVVRATNAKTRINAADVGRVILLDSKS